MEVPALRWGWSQRGRFGKAQELRFRSRSLEFEMYVGHPREAAG